MDQAKIISILNARVFDAEKQHLIQTVAKNPQRFVGIFRSTTPKLKLVQNILQSREIRFGDALEEIIEQLIGAMGFENLPKNITSASGEKLKLDQYFKDEKGNYYFIEQKVRDDHDSSKKRGQVTNFKEKLDFLKEKHNHFLTAIFYFIDPSLVKNRDYYHTKINEFRNISHSNIKLFYNGELFTYFENTHLWDMLQDALIQWRENVPQDITLDCEDDPKALSAISLDVWQKLANTEVLWESGVMRHIFPTGTAIEQVIKYYESQKTIKRRQTVVSGLRSILEKYYSGSY